MLKFIMDTMEGVEPAVAGLYAKQTDGKFMLTGIDGVVHKARLDEFRDNNIALGNALRAFGDVTPEQVKALTTELSEAKIKLKGNENIDEKVTQLVESRISSFRETAETEKKKLSENVQTLSSYLEEVVLENQISRHGTKLGIEETAIDDILHRAKATFKVDGKTPKAVDERGKPVYGADGTSPLAFDEWLGGLKKTSPHLFKRSVGHSLRTPGGAFTGDPAKMTPLQKIQQGLG